MKRLLFSLATVAFAATLGMGPALANDRHHHHHRVIHSMPGHRMMTPDRDRDHRYGNDKARCRDSNGRFLKRSDPRCLAK